jgi:hypothetical protein
VGAKIKVCVCSWTLEELARNLRHMGWPIIWKNARRLNARLPLPMLPLAELSLSEPSICNGNAAFRAESVGFDLAADFLYSIVIAVDFMAFKKETTFAFIGLCGIDKHLCRFGRVTYNLLKSNILGGIAQLVERLVHKRLGDCGLKRPYVDKADRSFQLASFHAKANSTHEDLSGRNF